jgi:putative transposase
MRKVSKPSTGEKPGGLTGGKKIKGRKRNVIVDVLGHLLGVSVTSARVHDGVAGVPLMEQVARETGRLQTVLADGTYGGEFRRQVQDKLGLKVEIARKADKGKGFVVQPKRWIVERFFAWLGHLRRLSKDYELTTISSENFIRLAALRRALHQATV